MTTSVLLPLLIEFNRSLVSRDFILDYLGDSSLVTREEAVAHKTIRPGKLFIDNGVTYVVTKAISDTEIGDVREVNLPTGHKLSFYTRFMLKEGDIENYFGPGEETTVGVYLLNTVVLVFPFGATISYVNGAWNIKKIEDRIAELTIQRKITPQQVHQYINYVYSLGSLNDMCVPALSERSITANPVVTAKRDELFEKHKDMMHDSNTMMAIEEECIALDKKMMKGDISTGFMISGKSYNVHRKHMFLMMGIVESFGDTVPKLDFCKTNLNDGWKLDELPILANDTRKGIYNRAKSTALGGAESKMLVRNFQDSTIVEDDCGDTRGLHIHLTKDNAKNFVYRNIIVDGKLVDLTPDVIDKYIGTTILLRSPMYCRSKNGYCYTCVDTRFKQINTKLLNIHPLAISSTVLSLSLKAMHGTHLTMLQVNDINSILLR